jgi:PKD domain
MKFLLLFPILSLFILNVSAQRYDNFWLFGYNSTVPDSVWGGTNIDFTYEPPLVFQEDRDMNLDATVASLCDSLGNLLCYTNGIYIANATHEIMQNGNGLNPGPIADNHAESGYSVVFSEFFLLAPGNPGTYYLFHLKLDYHPVLVLARTTLYRTTIDMSQDNGLGGVTEKNFELLTDGNFGTLNAVKHANGRDWWILLSEKKTNRYYRFLLSSIGLEGPFEQVISPLNDVNNINGSIVFSPDGSKLIRYEVANKIYVHNFNRCTGLLELVETIPIPGTTLGGGVSISPNSRFLYVTSTTEVYQFDLWADNIGATKKVVAVYDGYADPFSTTFFLMQLGPDGKIYLNTNNGSRVLHVINQPNKEGDSCYLVQHGVMLPTRNRFTSPHFPNYRLGPIDGSSCDTLGFDNHPLAGWRYDTIGLTTIFTDNSFYEPTQWNWDFGDGIIGEEVSPVHTYDAPGTYEVCLTVSNQYDSDTLCKPVTVDGTTPVDEMAETNRFKIYPNPAPEKATIEYETGSALDARLVLFDMYGQQLNSALLHEYLPVESVSYRLK